MLSRQFSRRRFAACTFLRFRQYWVRYIFAAAILAASTASCHQPDGPPMPAFDLLLVDGSTSVPSKAIPNGVPAILVFFSPDCEHCQHETADLLAKMDSFQEVRFYFVTDDPMERLKVFQQYYHLSRYRNVVLAQDHRYSFFNLLKPTGTPCTFIYDRQKRLRAVFNGESDAAAILAITQKM